MIKSVEDVSPVRRYRGLISGKPGVRKTSTAMTAPRPLLVDTDRGIHRVEARYRKGSYIQPQSYDEVLSDLDKGNPMLADFDTIVLDTGGSLLDLMKSWAIAQSQKNGQKDGRTLSQTGYGAVGNEFARLIEYISVTLFKHVIVIFHAKEDKDGDVTRFLLAIEGKMKNAIWNTMDFGFFMEPQGKDILCGFAPTERYDAKRTRGLPETMKLPSNDPDAKFLTDIFSLLDKSMAEDMEHAKKYNLSLNEAREVIDAINSAESATEAIEKMKAIEYFGESYAAAKTLFGRKVAFLGLVFKDGVYVNKEVQS